MLQDMLNNVIKFSLVVIFFLELACNQKEITTRNRKILEISKEVIGNNEYHKTYKQVLDSLNKWCIAKLPAYKSIWYYEYRLDSVLCFNTKKDRMVTAILIQCNEPGCQSDDVQYFYGAKIKDQWYFFRGGGTMVVLRKHYQKDIHTPIGFEKLHELAINHMLRGYIKKGQWEVNDAFFTSLLEGSGWGDFNNQPSFDWFLKGKRFTTKKEYYEHIYMECVKNNWRGAQAQR